MAVTNGRVLLQSYINFMKVEGDGNVGRRAQSAPHYLGIIKAGKKTARRYTRPNDFYGVCNIAGT